jgi:hypothetical protein
VPFKSLAVSQSISDLKEFVMPVFIQRETPDDDAVWNNEFQGRRYTVVIQDPCDPKVAATVLADLDRTYKRILKAGAIERDFSQEVQS